MDSIVDPPDDLIATEPCLPPWGPYGRDFTLGLVSLWSKFVLKVWNSTEVENKEDFLKQTMHRDEGQGLITVANHTRYSNLLCCVIFGNIQVHIRMPIGS